MTVLARAARRLELGLARLRVEAIAFAFVLVATAAAIGISLAPASDPASAAVTAPISPAKAEQLVEATSGAAASEVQATGDQAKMINAALPFAQGPLHSARPFALAANTLDQQRALLCLTQAIYYEAGYEPVEGRRAVAQVVLNRMRHPAYPKSICGVVYQGAGTRVCQFTFVCDGALYRSPSRDAWARAEDIARAALSGYVDTAVGEATHYHADYVAPKWAPLLAKVARIGQHIFYRWPGSWGQPQAFSGRYIGEPRDPLAMRPPMPGPRSGQAELTVAAAVDSGPPVPRATNDVGGLLDTSKGWTLTIPAPTETGGAAQRLIAAQERGSKAPAGEPKVIASR